MTQKRFLTSTEVFQLFGVDDGALEKLVAAGDVTALPDLGSFKYRSEDFVKLVKDGKLTPRTSGEMFQVDAKGDVPFLKLKDDDHGLKFDEEVSFLEIDEAALNEYANELDPPPRTPVVPEKWFSDTDQAIEIPPSAMKPKKDVPPPKTSEEETDFDLDISRPAEAKIDSDSDVRLADANADIDLEGADVPSSGSDSDVRLEGPVSWRDSPPRAPAVSTGSDSDVRLVAAPAPQSDSDVTLVTGGHEPKTKASGSSPSLSQPAAKKPDSDSDVQFAQPAGMKPDSDSDVQLAETASEKSDSDSDVVIVGPAPGQSGIAPAPAASETKTGRDSDVKLSDLAEMPPDAEPAVEVQPVADAASDVSDFDRHFGDSEIRLDASDLVPEIVEEPIAEAIDSDSEIVVAEIVDEGMESDEFEIALDEQTGSSVTLKSLLGEEHAAAEAGEAAGSDVQHEPAKPDSDVVLESTNKDSDISLDDSPEKSGIVLDEVASDSDVTLEAPDDSGIAMVESDEQVDSGITLDPISGEMQVAPAAGHDDSGITLDPTSGEMEVVSSAEHDDSDIKLDFADSERAAVIGAADPGSGIMLEPEAADSGIQLEQSDSGIRFVSKGDSDVALGDADSGIMLEQTDSGISVAESDSGITLERTDSDINLSGGDSGITLAAADSGITLAGGDSGITLAGGDSGIAVAGADSGITLEDDDELSATFVEGSAVRAGDGPYDGTKTENLQLSGETFRDSGFDVSLSSSDHTMEMAAEDEEMASSDGVTQELKSAKQKPGGKTLDLSDSFQMDDSIEVEDLDISEDLDSAGEEFSEEFVGIDEAPEEVLDVSDEAFSTGEVSAELEEDEAVSEATIATPSKRRPASSEPGWGMAAVIPIACAALFMFMTSTVLLGGMMTMWTGDVAPAPAGMLISTLAGMSPF